MHDLASLVLHFHFLCGVTELEKNIDVWQDVERDRMRINLWRRLPILSRCFHLILQFSNGACATAGNSLITRSENTANSKSAMQWINRHQGDCGLAIRVGNEPPIFLYILPLD